MAQCSPRGVDTCAYCWIARSSTVEKTSWHLSARASGKTHRLCAIAQELVRSGRKVLFSPCSLLVQEHVDQVVKNTCLDILKRYEIEFLEIGTDGDHVHFLIQSVPMYSPTKITRTVKSITAREAYRLAPEVKQKLWGGEFWGKGYFINKVGQHADVKTVAPAALQRHCNSRCGRIDDRPKSLPVRTNSPTCFRSIAAPVSPGSDEIKVRRESPKRKPQRGPPGGSRQPSCPGGSGKNPGANCLRRSTGSNVHSMCQKFRGC